MDAVHRRDAREFHLGGPSFTLCGEDNSGLRALEAEGVCQVAFIPTPGSVDSFAREFGEKIIARF